MADIRINSLPSTATSFNTDDYIAIDGASGGTRKMLAATLPLTDVTLGGSSGPSVKSSLSARAPRQGLVFDGSQVAGTTSVPAFGMAAFTASAIISPTFTSNGTYIFGGASGAFDLFVDSSGVLNAGKVGVGAISSGTTLTAGKYVLVTYVRTSTSASGAAFYVNGVQVATVTDANDYTTAITLIGNAVTSTSAYQFIGGLEQPIIYNRALSASEVVALYESGAPAGADYNSASNTSVITGDNSTFASDTGYWTLGSGATISGGAANFNGTANAYILRNSLMVAGRRYRATVTVSNYVSGAVVVSDNIGSVYGSFTANGTYTVDFVSLYPNLIVKNVTGTASVDTITFFNLGLLLAPDAAQAGGGLVWYDTSGNAANITLPASGVSWNVPSSRVLGGNWTTSGNLTVSGTGNSTFAGNVVSKNTAILFGDGADNSASLYATGGPVKFWANATEAARIFANGNLFIGASPVDGGQKLQVSGTAAIAGTLTLTTAASSKVILTNTAAAGVTWELNSFSDGDFFLTHAGVVNALQISKTSGNATFAGSVKVNSANGIDINSGGTTAIFSQSVSGVRKNYIYFDGGNTTLGTDTGDINLSPAGSKVVILSGKALRLGNAYTAGAPTATGYVTIQDSAGNTYKVLVGT